VDLGKSYFSGNVGIGTFQATFPLTIGSGWGTNVEPNASIVADGAIVSSFWAWDGNQLINTESEALVMQGGDLPKIGAVKYSQGGNAFIPSVLFINPDYDPNAPTVGNVTIGSPSRISEGGSNYVFGVRGKAKASGIFTTSDIRFKTNITPIPDALKKVAGLRGVSFDWNEAFRKSRPQQKEWRREIGLIAQEVQKELPELVTADKEGYLALDYGRMSAVLLQAIKEQQKIIEDQDRQIGDLEEEVNKQEGSR